MRILSITDAYPPHHYGGYELTCADVMRRAAAAGHETRVLTSTAMVPGVEPEPEAGVSRTLLPYWDWNANEPAVPRSPVGRLRIERHNLSVLRAELHRSTPDVVSVWNMCGLSMALLTECERRGLPIVVTVENEWLRLAPEQDGWTRMWRRRRLRRPASVFGVPTQGPTYRTTWANFASDFMRRTAPQRELSRFRACEVIHLGVDLNDFPLTDRDPRPWEWRLLYVGRLDPAKGIETLLRAVARVPETATLRVIGGSGTAYQHTLAELASSLGLTGRVFFDRRPREELREEYIAADVVVFPSEWEEPFGLVPLEAMACGAPLVSTLRGGAAEFLEPDANCLSFDAGDDAGLAAALVRLSSDPALRAQLVAGGQRTAAQLTIDRHAEAVLAMHEAAIEARNVQP